MDSINYKILYELQDRVLKIIFKTEQIFYLTGGTCISRFYHEKRYSDDLDFFTHDNRQFHRAVKEIEFALQKEFNIKNEVSSKDFIRFIIDDLLQIDFVNDRIPQYKSPIYLENGYIIDNLDNILANKITAIISRDNAKDIFDIYLIDKYEIVNWNNIIDIAHQKAEFNNDELIVRLKTFPHSLLKKIILIDKNFLDHFDKEFKELIEKIENSIYI